MKNIIRKKIVLFVSALLIFGCSDFEELNTDPNGITSATPGLLATKLLLDITRRDIRTTKGFMFPFMRGKYILWTEFPQGQQYNDFGRTGFGEISRLIDAQKMVEETEGFPDQQVVNSYKGLSHFIRAYNFFKLTMQVGDIPYSEALKGESDNVLNPKYDTQKEVFIGILNELDMANDLFADGGTFEGDIIYNGDPLKWQKMVNSFALKVLINLYKKTGDSDLNVIQRFNQILTSRPIFTSNNDNFSLVFKDADGQRYPYHKLGNQTIIYPMVSSTIIDKLKEYQDFRLFYYAAPSAVKLQSGFSHSDFDAYVGTEPSAEYFSITGIYSSGDFSDINDRYKELPEGEPVYLLSYAQVEFILAEASIRGWISNNAETHYQNGIKAAMEFVANNTPNNPAFNHDRLMDATYINDYYNNTPLVHLTGTDEQQIEKIITQKYLATYLQSPLSALYENRRTGYPEFIINPDTNRNIPADKLPVRWMYPSDELEFNTENVNEAIQRQYSGVDDTNGIMWILN